MESIKKKMQFSLAMLLSLFVTVIFSIIFALAAQQASINGMITISYRLPATLISGSDFNNTIPEDCSSIIFDYASQYPQITSSSTMTTKTLDTKDLGLNAGGISSYYDQTNKTLYVLSNYEILANPDCSNMFMFKTLVSSITFNNFNTSNVTNLVGMFQYCASLTELDLSGFNSTNATNMAGMFYCCSKLTKLDISSFNTSNVTSMSSMFQNCNSLTELDLSGFNTSNITSTYSMFNNCASLIELDLSGWNTSNVISMSFMFSYCNKLKTIWVGNLWSVVNVISSDSMFSDCSSLVGGEGTKFSSSNIGKTYARVDGGPSSPGYFTLYKSASLVDGTTFNSNIPNDCSSIIFDYARNHQSIASSLQATPIDAKGAGLNDGGISSYYDEDNTTLYVLSNYEIYANLDCSSMFRGKTEILSITFNNFNTSNVTNMSRMFAVYNTTDGGDSYITGKLKNIVGLNKFNTSNVTDMTAMFYLCYNLTSLDLANFDTSNVTSMARMFYGCAGLTELDLSNFNTNKVTMISNMFQFCIELKTIWVGNYWETSSVGVSGMMFTGCESLVGGEGTKINSSPVDKTYARVDGGPSNPGYLTLSTPATLMSGSAFNSKIPSDCTEVVFDRYGFYASKFTNWSLGENVSVDASGNTTSEIKIFKDGTKLYVLSKGKILANPDCSSMFLGKTEIVSITFNNFNTSNVTNMNSMFAVYYSNGNGYTNGNLGKIDGLNKFNTSNVTNMMHMFRGCTGLTSLDLSGFDTSNVTNMAFMFYYCINLKSLNLSSFNTSQVVIMAAMFGSCENLTELDLSSFNTSQVTAMTQMFVFCKNLKTIYVGDAWTTNLLTAYSNPMFMECFSLCGGKGTVWNSDHLAYDYARVDGGPSNPGYFTLKT